MKDKGFVAIAVCMVAIATVFALMGVEGIFDQFVYQSALAETEPALPEIIAVESITHEVFLPLILNGFPPPPPDVPVLNEINNPNGENNYTVSWSSTANATSYILQEDDNDNFSSPANVYEGPDTTKVITGKDIGTYYYRVKATNSAYESGWSNVQSVVVTEPLEIEEWKIIKLPGEESIGYGIFPSFALDSGGNPHISYSRGNVYWPTNESLLAGEEVRNDPNVLYLGWDGNKWIKHYVDSNNLTMDIDTSLAINSNDQPMIAYPKGSPYGLGLAWWGGTSWEKTSIHGLDFYPVYVNLALRANNNPCISFLNQEISEYRIYFSCATKDGWPAELVGTSKSGTRSMLFYYHSLVLAVDDTPHISYIYGRQDSEAQLYYATKVDGSWEREPLDGKGMGSYSSLALDSQNRPHISYHDHENGNLKYAKQEDGQWHIEIIDNSGIVGQFTSLALDSQDHPHISYIDATNGNLKYAFWDGSQWQIETIDDTGEVWRWTSLALDGSDFAHIVYRRLYNMRYATNSGFTGE